MGALEAIAAMGDCSSGGGSGLEFDWRRERREEGRERSATRRRERGSSSVRDERRTVGEDGNVTGERKVGKWVSKLPKH